MARRLFFAFFALALAAPGCARRDAPEQIVRSFPIQSVEDVLTRTNVDLDAETSSDGNGALRIAADEPTTVRLFEINDLALSGNRLVYRARLRTEDVEGQAYLEMWCRFPGKGEYFSRALHAPMSGTTDWTSQETPFFLQGNAPDQVKLNLVVAGSGTVWIDDVALLETP